VCYGHCAVAHYVLLQEFLNECPDYKDPNPITPLIEESVHVKAPIQIQPIPSTPPPSHLPSSPSSPSGDDLFGFTPIVPTAPPADNQELIDQLWNIKIPDEEVTSDIHNNTTSTTTTTTTVTNGTKEDSMKSE